MNLFKSLVGMMTCLLALAMPACVMAAADAGDPAFCDAVALQGNRELAFRAYCRGIEAALQDDGSFQHALEQRQRIRAKLLFTALPTGEIAAALLDKSSGDALIDASLIKVLRRQRFISGSNHAETFTLPVALQPIENLPAVVYRLGK